MGKWYFTKYVASIFFICCYIGCSGQKISKEKIKEFVPKSAISSKIRVYIGDLNHDGIEDALLRFKVINEPIENEHFYILLGRNDGTIRVYKKDIFSFDNKNGMVFDTVSISKDGDFTVNYRGKENTYGSYRKITFNYHADEVGNHYWILNRDEELFLHKVFAPAPQKPIIVTKKDMRGIGGEFFGNIKENLYDVMLRMKIKEHIPDSTSECEAYSGDLNRDSFDDIILRFKLRNEEETREHFHIFIGQNNGTYKLVAKNDSLDLDGVDGTVFDKIVIKNGYFSIEYWGYGNTGGSYDIITFKYSEEDKNWVLHRQGSKFVHRYFTEGEPAEIIRTQKDFGKILFEEYR
ncbi:MAG: hypothetical protein PWR03_1593 [Tenuifilum sp.]|uniref:hypothetical protein n=1 Tax=Tenuifilum sp. TaxID=2760880 RepID=UPI0024AA3599|nr:hypothetical protein [Tenuifilum sp.]MDI3527410.1 hypothetical protein [Tenuifilum sp.]